MKIHYLVKNFDDGGSCFAMIPVLKLLRNAGYDIDITACYPGNMLAAERFEESGFTCRTLAQKPLHKNKIKLIWQFLKLLQKSERPHIIMTSLPLAVFVGQVVGKILTIPVISWKHSAILKKSTIRTLSRSKFWITDSQNVSRLLKNAGKIRHEDIFVWPLFYCEEKKNHRPVWTGTTPLRIGSIGRLHAVKNYPLLLEGIALFRKTYPEYSDKISISILGEGPDRKKIENKIKELSLESYATLLGYSPDVYNYLATLDVYAQPSVYEGMCMAAHEALSTGLPIMATAVGEMETSLSYDTGFILDGNIAQSICSNLKIIFDNPSILQIKSKNALDYMHQYYSKDAFEKHGQNVINHMKTLTLSNAL